MTLTVTASVAPLDAPAVQVSVSSSPSLTAPLVLWRVHEDGSRYRVLTEANAVVIGSWTGYDYHCPFNVMVQYTAEAGGLTATTAPEYYVLSSGPTWLVHASDPDLSVMVDKVMTVADYTYEDRSQKFLVLGSRLRVQRDDYPRGGEVGALVIKAASPANRAALKALFADNSPVLVNTPYTDDDIGWKWLSVGPVAISNPGKFLAYPDRYASYPYEEITPPDVDSATWTLDELAAQYAGQTLDDLIADYAGLTLDDLKLRVV